MLDVRVIWEILGIMDFDQLIVIGDYDYDCDCRICRCWTKHTPTNLMHSQSPLAPCRSETATANFSTNIQHSPISPNFQKSYK